MSQGAQIASAKAAVNCCGETGFESAGMSCGNALILVVSYIIVTVLILLAADLLGFL